MKFNRKLYLLICLPIVLFITGCGILQTTTIESEITMPITNEAIILNSLNIIMDNGKKLFSAFENYQDLDPDSQYEIIKKAEGETDAINAECNVILNACQNMGFDGIAYQIQLIQHAMPKPITNNTDDALDNAAVLYSLYFQQISSSFYFLSEDMRLLEEGKSIENTTKYFFEMKKMVRPETIINGITFWAKETEDGVVKYTYKANGDNDEAKLNYNLFLIALGMDTGLSLDFDGVIAHVYDGEKMVSAIMARYDCTLGNFFMISFPE